jgi:predicted AlkP superfamily phosphohydrolase/phosphomutase
LQLGDYSIPLWKGETNLLRKGKPFWKYLADRDIPTTIFKMPANFPCRDDGVKMVSGMGTPDLRGGYGNYTLFTTDAQYAATEASGGKVIVVQFRNHRMTAMLPGPRNTLKKAPNVSEIPLSVWRDPRNPMVLVRLQDREWLLSEGEWSGWIPLSFPMLGSLWDVKGICKVYVKHVHPHLSLYVSPINIHPAEPALPIAYPESYGEELVDRVGLFYTQGFPEDTKALSENVLSDDEYLELAKQVLSERKRLFQYELKRFSRLDQGMLFFYFSSLDQNSHMFWRASDQESPLYTPTLEGAYGNVLRGFYAEMDGVMGEVLSRFDVRDPDFTLIIISDHGFAPFRRQVNVNTWLYRKGYMRLQDERNPEGGVYFSNVDWGRTAAYNLGINSIYLNIKGRDRYGAVTQGEAESLKRRITADLSKLKDPNTGESMVSCVRVVPAAEQRRHLHAPDLLVGWKSGYRTSWKSILGTLEKESVFDNKDKWSGDHCVDPSLVPAILITNKRIGDRPPALSDMAATVLTEFNIPQPGEIGGKSIYGG